LFHQKQELPVAAMFANRSERNEHLDRGVSIDASYLFLAHLAKRFQRCFLDINQSETRIKKSSPLKQLGQMNRNLVGSIYERSSIKSAHFVLIR
jgi:hypothetical protein